MRLGPLGHVSAGCRGQAGEQVRKGFAIAKVLQNCHYRRRAELVGIAQTGGILHLHRAAAKLLHLRFEVGDTTELLRQDLGHDVVAEGVEGQQDRL